MFMFRDVKNASFESEADAWGRARLEKAQATERVRRAVAANLLAGGGDPVRLFSLAQPALSERERLALRVTEAIDLFEPFEDPKGLAEDLGVGLDTVMRHLGWAEDLGIVERVPAAGRGRWAWELVVDKRAELADRAGVHGQ
jgi:DNA-binding transcriptional ArsR family regulator